MHIMTSQLMRLRPLKLTVLLYKPEKLYYYTHYKVSPLGIGSQGKNDTPSSTTVSTNVSSASAHAHIGTNYTVTHSAVLTGKKLSNTSV